MDYLNHLPITSYAFAERINVFDVIAHDPWAEARALLELAD